MKRTLYIFFATITIFAVAVAVIYKFTDVFKKVLVFMDSHHFFDCCDDDDDDDDDFVDEAL